MIHRKNFIRGTTYKHPCDCTQFVSRVPSSPTESATTPIAPKSDATLMKEHLRGCDECSTGHYCAEGNSYGGEVTHAYLTRITVGNGCRPSAAPLGEPPSEPRTDVSCDVCGREGQPVVSKTQEGSIWWRCVSVVECAQGGAERTPRHTWPGTLVDAPCEPYEGHEAAAIARANEMCIQPDRGIQRWAMTVMCQELEIEMQRLSVTELESSRSALTEELAAAKRDIIQAEYALGNVNVVCSKLEVANRALTEEVGRLRAQVARYGRYMRDVRGSLEHADGYHESGTRLCASTTPSSITSPRQRSKKSSESQTRGTAMADAMTPPTTAGSASGPTWAGCAWCHGETMHRDDCEGVKRGWFPSAVVNDCERCKGTRWVFRPEVAMRCPACYTPEPSVAVTTYSTCTSCVQLTAFRAAVVEYFAALEAYRDQKQFRGDTRPVLDAAESALRRLATEQP